MEPILSMIERGVCQDCLKKVGKANLIYWSNRVGWTAYKCQECIDAGNNRADQARANAAEMRRIEAGEARMSP